MVEFLIVWQSLVKNFLYTGVDFLTSLLNHTWLPLWPKICLLALHY